ncbi:MAG: hypothetical protein R2764_03340 [Bacteroidales bacterium]
MHVAAKFEGKNDLRVKGLKISGNAEHVFKNKVLHHGTLLFSSDLSQLNHFIKVDSEKYTDKSVKSIRSKVANIVDFLHEPIAINVFKEKIIQFIGERFPNCTEYALTPDDIDQIQEMVNTKYGTWQWNYGYSPKFISNAKIETEKKFVNVEITIEKGIIKKIESEVRSLQLQWNQILADCTFDPKELKVRLQNTQDIHKMTDIQIDRFVSQLFN